MSTPKSVKRIVSPTYLSVRAIESTLFSAFPSSSLNSNSKIPATSLCSSCGVAGCSGFGAGAGSGVSSGGVVVSVEASPESLVSVISSVPVSTVVSV